MSLQFSLYLDLVRFFAAVLVLLYHANHRYLSAEVLPLSTHGHIAVIFFFVLSGYVIAYVADAKENSISLYWSSRLSRIYSVALPAILLTPLLDLGGAAISQIPEIYHNTPNDLWPVRILASLFFLNEIWFNSIMSFSNAPFWSLCYEMSYYILFSLIIFTKGKLRWGAVSVFCLIIGPKILLLLPVWLTGVYLHHSKLLINISKLSGWILFIISTITLVLWEYRDVTFQISTYFKSLVGEKLYTELAFSKHFLSDWVIGMLVFINFVAFRAIALQFSILLNPLKLIIRFAASFTLSIYLFHQPLLKFYAALISGKEGNIMFYWQTMTATVVTIFVLGYLTEHRREDMRQWLRLKLLIIEKHPFIQRITI